jgi:L-malate glycosyltransferase
MYVMKKPVFSPVTLRLCLVGPMIGRNHGHVTTQGEILSDHFKREGYLVTSVSSFPNRYMRLADIVKTLIRCRRKIDVLHIQVYGERSFVVEDIASWLGQQFGHRIVMVLRGGTLPDFMNRFPKWTHRVLGRAHALIAPSEFLARAVGSHGFQARVIPNLIDLSAYPYRCRQTVTPRLFWMRSFYPYYNPAMAVRALERIQSKFPEATLVMAGRDMGIESDVRKLVKVLGLEQAVSFPGFLDMESKVRIGGSTDIFLNTNNLDNMPVAVLEACAMGLPVVATNVGGISDLLTDEKTALLVPDNNVELMVEAVFRLVNETGLARKLSSNGRRLAESASWKDIYPQWRQVFTDIGF